MQDYQNDPILTLQRYGQIGTQELRRILKEFYIGLLEIERQFAAQSLVPHGTRCQSCGRPYTIGLCRRVCTGAHGPYWEATNGFSIRTSAMIWPVLGGTQMERGWADITAAFIMWKRRLACSRCRFYQSDPLRLGCSFPAAAVLDGGFLVRVLFSRLMEQIVPALKLDPKFDGSQLGIADTYSLMGQYEKARENYAAAAELAPDMAFRLQYLGQSAQTWVREGKFDEADRRYSEIIDKAHSADLHALEAALLTDMALYQQDDARAFTLLRRAELESQELSIAASDREDRLAIVLRDRAVRAAQCGNKETASAALGQLLVATCDGQERDECGDNGRRSKTRSRGHYLGRDFSRPSSCSCEDAGITSAAAHAAR